jgi:hypothetical protein
MKKFGLVALITTFFLLMPINSFGREPYRTLEVGTKMPPFYKCENIPNVECYAPISSTQATHTINIYDDDKKLIWKITSNKNSIYRVTRFHEKDRIEFQKNTYKEDYITINGKNTKSPLEEIKQKYGYPPKF